MLNTSATADYPAIGSGVGSMNARRHEKPGQRLLTAVCRAF